LFGSCNQQDSITSKDTIVKKSASEQKAQDLQGRLDGLTIPPAKMVSGASDLIEEVASTKISGEEDRYSGTDLSDFQANVDGAQKIFNLSA